MVNRKVSHEMDVMRELLKLDLVKAISESNVKRALYLNDYLYILGMESITILDENNWESVNKFRFGIDS